jgi:hypothetical protein
VLALLIAGFAVWSPCCRWVDVLDRVWARPSLALAAFAADVSVTLSRPVVVSFLSALAGPTVAAPSPRWAFGVVSDWLLARTGVGPLLTSGLVGADCQGRRPRIGWLVLAHGLSGARLAHPIQPRVAG